ncbi:MAG: hypothetical protein M3277_01100 [Actinomycetota bacterium]|nr:hypothetical protein [Actinomycetota bacterium]
MQERLRRLGPTGARRLLLAGGLAVLLAIAGVMYLRDVERVEIISTLLFIPIFIAFVTRGLKGGVIVGLLAVLAYIWLRYPAIDAIGAGRFVGLIASRALGLIAFGAIGGAATEVLEASLQKLELYDQIDDATGLFNARFFLQDTDLEMARSKRYKTIFSVAFVSFPTKVMDGLRRRQQLAITKELGRLLADGIRNVDRAVHGADGVSHRLAVVMPETGREGALIFTERLRDKVSAYLQTKGVEIGPRDVVGHSVTYPVDGEPEVQRLRSQFASIERLEHPENQAT